MYEEHTPLGGQAVSPSNARQSPRQSGEKLKLLVTEACGSPVPREAVKVPRLCTRPRDSLPGRLGMSWKEVGTLLGPEMKIQMKYTINREKGACS